MNRPSNGTETELWLRVKAVFLAALDYPDPERSAFVARECGADPELRDEVLSLLATDKAAASFGETPAAALLAMGPPAGRSRPRLAAGDRLGPYEVTAFLSAGGMGEVYRACDTVLRRPVAIKTVNARKADPVASRRLVREAQHAAVLSHPNICTIYEVGEAEGAPFIVMALVEGQPLSELLRAAVPAFGDALDYGLQVADALEHAHRHRIIHRDLKSSNIVIDTTGRPIVLDFGLAKRLTQDTGGPGSDSTITAEGGVAGTLSHMAPEVLLGGRADVRSDVWSLGVLLYELTTGALPFTGRTAFETSLAILNEPPRPMPGSVPLAMRLVIERCLVKDPEGRYQRAEDVRNALEAIRRRRAWPLVGQLFIRARRRTIYATGAGAALVLAAAVAGPGAWRGLVDPGAGAGQNSVAVLPFKNMSDTKDDEYFSDGMTEELISALAKVEGLRVTARTSAFMFKDQQGDVAEIGAHLHVRTVLQGSVRRAGNKVRVTAQLSNAADGYQLWSETYDRDMQDIFAIQDDISGRIVAALKIRLAGGPQASLSRRYPANLEAYNLYLKGRYQWNTRTGEGLKRALGFFQQALDHDPTFALAYVGMADVYLIMGGEYRILPPREARPQARAAALKALDLDPNLGEVHASLGMWYCHELDWKRAEHEFQRALELVPMYAPTYHWYAMLLASERRFDEALMFIRRANELDPLSPYIQGTEGLVLFFARRYGEALQKLDAAVAAYPDFAALYGTRSAVLIESGRFPEAVADAERMVRLSDRSPPSLARLGYAYGRAGRTAAALGIARELAELSNHRFVSPFDRALVPLALGDTDQALRWLEGAFKTRDASVSLQNASPVLDGVRLDPRFQALQQRIAWLGLQPRM